MAKNEQSLQQTIQLIIDIMSFETSDDDLKRHLANTAIDWDQIVVVASKHLVLTTVYCRLHQKSLLSFLPKDLVAYLEELTHLNRERNQTLLGEVVQISQLFTTHQIQYVFIKGTALLAGNYFKDIGERMIGDIDILVASKDLDKAFDLLVSEGYDKFVSFNYEVKNYRHLPRQISNKRLGAIELHDQLLKHDYNHLIVKDEFLLHKKLVKGVAIPNSEHQIWNTILAHQINDRSFYYNRLKLKGIYDVFVLGLPRNEELIRELYDQKYGMGFLNLASVFCPSISPSKQSAFSRLSKRTYLLSLNSPKFGNQLLKLKSSFIGIKDRLILLLLNKSYRIHVIKNKLKI